MIRNLLFILGVFSVGLGIAGAFLPLLPTTPFVLLAAWCFYKSSPKAHAWLQQQPLLGPALRDWQQRRAIKKKTKVLALSMMALSIMFIWFKPIWVGLKITMTCLLIFVSVFILKQRSQ